MNALGTCLALTRTGIALFAAGAAITAALVAGCTDWRVLGRLAAGVFLLACGASALNQYQERDLDARMTRTACRPLPAGSLSPPAALASATVLIIAGLLLLSTGGPAPLLGTAALLWYNGLYTPLKRRTAFAAVYGAIVGVAPPAIGWTAAEGSLHDPRFIALAALFLVWQIPHFWLLLLQRESDYRAAGLPALTDSFGTQGLSRITLLWTLAAAIMPLLLPIFGVVRSPAVTRALPPVMVLTVLLVLRSLRYPSSPAPFRWINVFLAVVMALLSLDPLVRRMG